MTDKKETDRTPYFIYRSLERLRENPGSEDALLLRRRIAASIGDTLVLESLLGDLPMREDFYPDCTHSTPGTIDAIDTFLTNFGRGGAGSPTGVQAIDALMLAEEGEEAGADVEASIPTEAAADMPDEKKALEMIKKRQFRGAYAIIQALSLNNPEKSVYFADQMRFLKKLIYVETRSGVGSVSL